jgi:hypothetical protein
LSNWTNCEIAEYVERTWEIQERKLAYALRNVRAFIAQSNKSTALFQRTCPIRPKEGVVNS